MVNTSDIVDEKAMKVMKAMKAMKAMIHSPKINVIFNPLVSFFQDVIYFFSTKKKLIVDVLKSIYIFQWEAKNEPTTGKWRYTGSHAYNIRQLNNKQVFGNNQYTKQPKYEHNRNTTFSDYKFTTKASTPIYNF